MSKGKVMLKKYSYGIVTIGFGGVSSVRNEKSILELCSGTVVFEGSARFSRGTIIKNKGHLIFGDRFNSNKNCTFSCTQEIIFGKDCLLGWNIHVRDSDGHNIISFGKVKPSIKPVIIGNHIWIASESSILKGSIIPDDCVIGYDSLVNTKFTTSNTIIAGHPATVVASGINWHI